MVLGADSVIDLNGEIISKPKDRKERIKNIRKTKWEKSFINKFSETFSRMVK